jgi:NADPH:quinone reductase-like Zn-dependent oxidoreductase
MKAIVLNSFGGVDNLQLLDWPKPEPKAGEVRIQIKAISFNPVDYKMRQGRFGGNLPLILGRDLSGTVDAVGEDVTDFSVGDEVYAYLGGPKSNGSYAEYVCVPTDFVGKKPLNLSFAQAAAVPLVGLTAYQSVMDKAKVQAYEAIFIAGGAGGVGTMAIQLARYLGAKPILTTAGSDESARYLTQELGILPEHILRYKGLSLDQLKARVLEMNRGRFVEAAFDFVGGLMKRLCCEVINYDGRVVSIVEEPEDFHLDIWNGRKSPLFIKSATFHFELLSARAMFGSPETWKIYRRELNTLTELIETGHIKPPTITHLGEFSAESVRRAHILLEEGHVQGKLVLSVG